jgi:hypothetical protein
VTKECYTRFSPYYTWRNIRSAEISKKKARREDGERSVESIGLKIISNTGVKVKKIVWINRK